MREIIVLLMLFSGCSGCIYLEIQTSERCIPKCGEYVYANRTQNGECVCDTTKVMR